ncbi:hypothetical protein WR25_12377 [Diploscapter pachys]|uniref:Uncharacterized protein n=1 Tax=Diploscapter pachys TaxID=2018661 RepID=A0A2A2J9Z8_9BILA|nr:hypothetical protein WR25_12377 [Diploscapter pachys]
MNFRSEEKEVKTEEKGDESVIASTTEVSVETNPGQPDDIIVLKNGHAIKLDANQTSEIGALLKTIEAPAKEPVRRRPRRGRRQRKLRNLRNLKRKQKAIRQKALRQWRNRKAINARKIRAHHARKAFELRRTRAHLAARVATHHRQIHAANQVRAAQRRAAAQAAAVNAQLRTAAIQAAQSRAILEQQQAQVAQQAAQSRAILEQQQIQAVQQLAQRQAQEAEERQYKLLKRYLDSREKSNEKLDSLDDDEKEPAENNE